MHFVEKPWNRGIKLVTIETRGNYLVSEPNYHTTQFFTETLLAIEIKKTQTLRNKSAFLELSLLKLSKTVMYESWDDYIKSK